MYSAWTKHLKNEDAKDKFQKRIYNSKEVLDRLTVLLNELELNTQDKELNPKTYETANWAYRQADINGYKRCLGTIRELINLDQKD